ncbi:MAG: gamma-glutamyl-gamma-aminobutyrate hydrolase family protein [Planctomycetales bacterium]|nr:gamma-glutamyl-gamma-aminobutyrate hydrolase family protein [Planctomycetales bacterium]
MAKKPLIGLNGDFRPAKKDVVPLSWFNSGYYDSISAAGGVPMLIPPYSEDADMKQIVSMLDGIVLAGCTLDLDIIRLGMDKHPAARPMPQRREDFDRRLCKMAIEMRMPILAIGSSMQLMNVLCGGTIFRHISEDCPKALHHRDPVESTLRHIIEIVPGSRVDTIYGPGEIRVNSSHHMAVDQIAKPFKVTARAPDGVIEAFEAIDERWWCVGVQWHPESESASALDMQVFENLLAACAADEAPATLPMRRAA